MAMVIYSIRGLAREESLSLLNFPKRNTSRNRTGFTGVSLNGNTGKSTTKESFRGITKDINGNERRFLYGKLRENESVGDGSILGVTFSTR